MTGIDHERVRRLLGRPELARLVAALRRRLEAGAPGGRVTLAEASDAEHQAVAALLGRPARPGGTLRVELADLERTLQRAGIAPDLASALVALGGPLSNRRAERIEADRAWGALCQDAAALAPERLRPWLDTLIGSGLLRRQARGEPARALALLADTFAVMAELPARGITLSALAARTVGDAHALDRGRPLGAQVRSAVAHLSRMELEGGDDGALPPLPSDAGRQEGRGAGSGGSQSADEPGPSNDEQQEGRDAPGSTLPSDDEQQENDRTLWAAVGVLVGGDITSTVLVLNLPAEPDTRTGRTLDLWRETGEPGYLTLRQLLRDPPRWRCAGQPLFVCENPAVVAEAAASLGAASAPLICTLGRPRAAALTLLDQLAAAGARLHYHGDFDWPGIAIANTLFRRYPLTPWRFDAPTLAAAPLPGGPLTGRPTAAVWDDALAPALAQRGRALHEEQQLAMLLADLAAGG